jgi:hypothetical protein
MPVTFVVSSVEEVKIIVNHFNKYPLVTQKQADFELFKKAFKLIKNKEHLTQDLIPMLKPKIESKIPDPH